MPAAATHTTQNTSRATRKRRSRTTPTPEQNLFQIISALWRGFTPPTQAAWNRLGSRMTPPLSGRAMFLSLNLTRKSASMIVLLPAPLLPEVVPFLDVPTLTATPARITLHHSGPTQPGPVQVYFAPARVPSPGMSPRVGDYRLAGTLSLVPAGGVDLTALFCRLYPPPPVVCEIWVRLLPLSPLRFRGQPVGAFAEVGAE